MGYTHYWSYDRDFDRRALGLALLDAREIVKAVQARGISLRGGMGLGEPMVGEGICFNGDASTNEDHEGFLFPMSTVGEEEAMALHGQLWDFCKTGRAPYDLAVCAVLLVLKHHLGSKLRVGSDGDSGEWQPAVDLVKELFGYDIEFVREDTVFVNA